MGKGQKLYLKAKKLIPGGNMLLSKRPEMHLPELWPAYYSKAKGCSVWDLDGNKYIDMSIMGIGTNTLGYGNEEVDKAVLKAIKNGNMSTLNCPEEVQLAERLIEINPWAEMVRFSRTGGEANAIAIRIARAACGKDNVAICGYHGWHDWYLSANHNNGDDLSSHLLKGLNASGVPKNLKNSVFPFQYNDYEGLKSLVNQNEIGIIKMEVERNFGPKDNFLQKVRKLATDKNIILIFDECTSGFRETFGGIHKKHEVFPDMAMYGKTLGNGYAITAVVGKKNIMEAAQKTFISSTFWTERIGPTAALKTLEIMEREKSWEIITEIGKEVQDGWRKLAKSHDLEIQISGFPAITNFNFKSPKHQLYKTFLTQEMLKNGYLAGTGFYSSMPHKKHLENFFLRLDPIFKMINKFENDEFEVLNFIDGPIVHNSFQRLN